MHTTRVAPSQQLVLWHAVPGLSSRAWVDFSKLQLHSCGRSLCRETQRLPTFRTAPRSPAAAEAGAQPNHHAQVRCWAVATTEGPWCVSQAISARAPPQWAIDQPKPGPTGVPREGQPLTGVSRPRLPPCSCPSTKVSGSTAALRGARVSSQNVSPEAAGAVLPPAGAASSGGSFWVLFLQPVLCVCSFGCSQTIRDEATRAQTLEGGMQALTARAAPGHESRRRRIRYAGSHRAGAPLPLPRRAPPCSACVSCAQVRNGSRVVMRSGGSSGQRGQKGRWRGIDADMDMSDDQQVGRGGARLRGRFPLPVFNPRIGFQEVDEEHAGF